MNPNKVNRLHVNAHIDIEIDGQPILLKGQGNQLEFVLGREESLGLLLNNDLHYGRQAANQLAAVGLTLTVMDRKQPILKIGYDASSPWSRLIFGSRHIAPTTLVNFLKIIRAYLFDR